MSLHIPGELHASTTTRPDSARHTPLILKYNPRKLASNMKREFALLLALCAFAAAMVPRERRAVDTETETDSPVTATTKICASTTPCGWSFYTNPYSKVITMDLLNTYCICATGLSCEEYEDDTAINGFVKKCKKI